MNGLFYEKDRWNYQHASLRSNIEKSTFPHQLKLAVRPFSPERETCWTPPLCEAFAFLRSLSLRSSTILPYAPKLWNQLSTRQTAEAVCRQLFYAIPRRIVNGQKLYRRKASKIFPSLEREGDHLLVRWWKVESSMFGWRNGINMLPIITQNGHTIHAIFDFLLIDHTTLCSNIQQSTFPHQQLLDVLYMAGGSTLKLETGYCV